MKFWREPLDAKRLDLPQGTVTVIKERCKGCGFCVDYCPRDVLELSHEFNSKGYHPPFMAQAERCVNCDLCEMICPEFAIFCVPKEEAV
jgi:2-oxoglutarate ferredoxin oxidoreductase subunit delta